MVLTSGKGIRCAKHSSVNSSSAKMGLELLSVMAYTLHLPISKPCLPLAPRVRYAFPGRGDQSPLFFQLAEPLDRLRVSVYSYEVSHEGQSPSKALICSESQTEPHVRADIQSRDITSERPRHLYRAISTGKYREQSRYCPRDFTPVNPQMPVSFHE